MLTIEQTRAKLRAIPRKCRCHPTCKGWGIFEVNRHEGVEIEGCDECLLYFAPSVRPTEDVDLNAPERPPTARGACDLVVEMRPPRKGERGWTVAAVTAEAALAEVLRESEELGWVADRDHGDVIVNGMRAITISFKPRAPDLQPLQPQEMMAAQGFTEPLTRMQPRNPRDAKMREIEDALGKLPMYNGWIFDVMGHTGAIGYVHPASEVTVFCTPDWETMGYVAISCESDTGKPLPSDLCGPVHDEGLEFDVMTDTAERLFALVKPWLDKHQPQPKCPECGRIL